jgi:hypothetical protein
VLRDRVCCVVLCCVVLCCVVLCCVVLCCVALCVSVLNGRKRLGLHCLTKLCVLVALQYKSVKDAEQKRAGSYFYLED